MKKSIQSSVIVAVLSVMVLSTALHAKKKITRFAKMSGVTTIVVDTKNKTVTNLDRQAVLTISRTDKNFRCKKCNFLNINIYDIKNKGKKGFYPTVLKTAKFKKICSFTKTIKVPMWELMAAKWFIRQDAKTYEAKYGKYIDHKIPAKSSKPVKDYLLAMGPQRVAQNKTKESITFHVKASYLFSGIIRNRDTEDATTSFTAHVIYK